MGVVVGGVVLVVDEVGRRMGPREALQNGRQHGLGDQLIVTDDAAAFGHSVAVFFLWSRPAHFFLLRAMVDADVVDVAVAVDAASGAPIGVDNCA